MAVEMMKQLPEDFGEKLKNLKTSVEKEPNDPYVIEKTEWGVSLVYTDKKNADNNKSFTIKPEANWTWTIAESHEGMITAGDLDALWVTLTPEESQQEPNVQFLTRVLKAYGLPPLSAERVIEIWLLVK